MAIQTSIALIYIATNLIVIIICIRLVVFVAKDALKYRWIPRSHVAILTDVPFVAMSTAVNREKVVMVPVHVVPITRVVAGQTRGGESSLDVVRVCIVVVIVVATVAIGWCTGVAACVARLTTEIEMGAVQGEGGLIVVKIGRLPAVDGMTILAGGGKPLMIRIRGTVIFALMAGDTVRRRTRITVGMAGLTIQRQMSSLQRKRRLIVVKTRRLPAVNGMAIFAGGRKSLVVRIRGTVVLALMAGDTVRRRA